MFDVDDEPIETLHIYLEREQPHRPSLLPIFLSVVALLLIVATSVLGSSQQPVTRAVIRVPAVPLPPKIFTAQVAVIPTGIKLFPATTAHGWLTFSNGSIIGQSIPADFIIQGVATDNAVYVPAGNANGYGYATVSAHSLLSGTGGNLATLAINQVIGSSIYIRNLSAFSGGRDSYSVKVVTAQDKQTALLHAQGILLNKSSGLHYPCTETIFPDTGKKVVTWRCQFVTYTVPSYMHVSSVQLIGRQLIVSVWFVVHPTRIWVK